MQEALWQAGREQGLAFLQRWGEALMEAERDVFLACHAYERGPHRRGWRNGYEGRWLDTVWGRLWLRTPRTRGTETPFRTLLFDRYARRQADLERAVEASVALGVSTRGLQDLLVELFGCRVSPATISAILAKLDRELRAWRERPLERSYRVLWLDAKHGTLQRPPRKGRKRRRRRGPKRQGTLLVAWGLRHDGREELVDFEAVEGPERYEAWEAFLTRLWRRGVRAWNRWDEHLELIVTDGHGGLEAAVETVFPTTPRGRCVFHKLQNLAAHLRDRSNRGALQASASAIFEGAQTAAEAARRLERWARRWRRSEPEAVAAFATDFERTLTYLTLPPALARRVRTTNPVERFLGEVEKATAHVPAWRDSASWERHVWALWKSLKRRGYRPTRPRPEFTRTS
jgi:transposase-like protein